MVSDRYRDPQAFILAFDNAYRIGESIVKDGNDIYLRAKNAAIEACNIVDEGSRFQQWRASDLKITVTEVFIFIFHPSPSYAPFSFFSVNLSYNEFFSHLFSFSRLDF